MLFFLDIKEYDTKGNLITRLTDGAHNVTKFYYDHEQLVGVEFPDGSKRAAAFDNLNRQAWAVDERGVTVTNTYDAASRLIRAQYLAWPGEGSLPAMACMPSAALNTSSFSCDTGAIYPTNSLNYSIVYLYDAVGNITNLSDWTGTTVYDYDSLNRCTSENIQHTALLNSLAFQKDFGYNIIDSRTNLTLELDGNTYCTTYDYDMLERLSNIVCSITSLNPISANYAYNPNGKLAGITRRNDGNVVAKTTYGYDTEQRLTSLYTTNAINSNMGLNYTYYAYADSQSRYATNQYSYDNRDQLVNERGGMPGHIFTNQFFYDQAQSRVMSVAGLGEAGSVSTDTYFYALANKLIARDTAFQFDNDGLDVSEELYHGTDPCNNDTDNDGWLDNYEIYTSNTNPWDPDTDGDRTVDGSDAQPFIPNSGLWFGATDGQLPQYWWTTSPSKPVYNYQAQATHKYYYDTAGNLASNIENGEVICYFYNAQNKLTKIQGSGFTHEFIYDSQNRRIGIKKGSQWLYDVHDGTIPIARMNVNGALSNYFVRGVGIAEGTGDIIAEINNSGTVKYYVSNHRGDTVECLSDNGSVVAHIQYYAFGNIVTNIGSFSPLYTFSTKEHLPEINAMLYAYRIYLIDCGRWTQRDPIDYQDSVNLYQFCGNNPVNIIDILGRDIYVVVRENQSSDIDYLELGHAAIAVDQHNGYYLRADADRKIYGAQKEKLLSAAIADGIWVFRIYTNEEQDKAVTDFIKSKKPGTKNPGICSTFVAEALSKSGIDLGKGEGFSPTRMKEALLTYFLNRRKDPDKYPFRIDVMLKKEEYDKLLQERGNDK